MLGKSDLPIKRLPAAPVPPPEIFPSEQHQEQRGQNIDHSTENIFQSNTSQLHGGGDERFKPMRNTSFRSFASNTRQNTLGSTTSNTFGSVSSIKDFTQRQDSKLVHTSFYEPLLDPELQNDEYGDRSSDSDSDVESEEEGQQSKRDSVQIVENKPGVFQGEEIQPAIRPVGKSILQTDLNTPPVITRSEVIKKQFTDDNYDEDSAKKKKARFSNIKVICNKLTNKCYLAKTWLKITFSKKSRNDESRAKWKSVDHVPATRLSEYEHNRISHSLETFTDYTANISLVKETTPLEPNFKTPIYSKQATSEMNLLEPAIFEQTEMMSPQMKDIIQLCDKVFYGN